MSDEPGRQKLLSRLRPDDNTIWSILSELAATPELERKRMLRPHNEAGFTWEEDAQVIEMRRRLDVALSSLTLLEIGYEIDIVTETELPVPLLAELKQLFQSEALLRFANLYLYFGIRILAGRVAPPCWMTEAGCPEPPVRDSNEQPFALMVPPEIAPLAQKTSESFITLVDLAKTAEPAEFQELPKRPVSPEILALTFLDGFRIDHEPPEHFELWLRGLRPETDPGTEAQFLLLSQGLRDWAIDRSQFYLSLELPVVPERRVAGGEYDLHEEEAAPRPLGGWTVTNPVAARFGLVDIYWIARLLRADVSANASVTYPHTSWLHLLRFHAGLRNETDLELSLWKAEEVLRSVFDLVCDLAQNAIELTGDKERQAFEPELRTRPAPQTVNWRYAADEELDEIERQRNRRRFREDRTPPHSATSDKKGFDGWMAKIRTGRQSRNLVGLAFSGGGIRSATFNLGVLQGLQEFDLLRKIDFLSSVSGGGFIGSWLVANVSRTAHWLGRLTNWEESIAHLRRYSNYLAPRTGLLSADTWSMWATWARNAFLIQLTGLAWLFVLLLTTLVGRTVFTKAGELPDLYLFGLKLPFGLRVPEAGLFAGVMTLLVLFTLLYNFRGDRAVSGIARPLSEKWVRLVTLVYNLIGERTVSGIGRASSGKLVRRLAVLPACLSAFALAALLWGEAGHWSHHHGIHSVVIRSVFAPLVITWIALSVIAAKTLSRERGHAVWISTLCVLVLYLELCGIMQLFVQWSADPNRFRWYAFVIGPSLVLCADTICVVLFIGFCGRNSTEPLREWWTRFGAWLAIYGAGYLIIATATVFGPLWTILLLHSGTHWTKSIKWGAIVSWIGTVIGGLLAGNSSKTTGETSSSKSRGLEILAKVGGLLFIVGALLASSTSLYLILMKLGTNLSDPWKYWNILRSVTFSTKVVALAVAIFIGSLFSWFFEINIFGLNQFYRNRLVRCYLGATRWAPGFRKPQPFTKFDGKDDILLSDLTGDFRGPFPILNCALNLGGSSDLALHTRHSASFSLTPLRCGADRPRVGYAPTKCEAGRFADGVRLGQAVAVSGAAASPNMGYNTSPLVAFLLTMFNVRLGWWFPNPGQRAWDQPGLHFSLYYLVKELFGIADEKNLFVNVSDGGHFENLGIYELVRRRCKVIIASDGECDESLQFGSLGNLVRICETDFGAKIDIDVSSIRQQKDSLSLAHCGVGKITYSNGSMGYLIYLKASITGDEDVGVAQYRSVHPSFPHETTADQFFSEDQFESYRRLGRHVVLHSFRGNQPGDHPVMIAEKLADVLAPAGCSSEVFLKHAKALEKIWERFRQSPDLNPFMDELMRNIVTPPHPVLEDLEFAMGLELIQLMENVFMDLRLDDFWDHPDNRGWAILFMRWARSPRFRAIWVQVRRTYGIRFEYFCEARLGLPRDRPIVRV